MTRPVKVLIVEDSDDDAKLAMRMLRRGGFDPTFQRVQDVAGLVDALKNEAWDAVLSDFRMPGFNGVDALKIFRSTGLDIPFIFFSGTIGEEIAVEAMKAGASDYVMKQHLARLAPVLERELGQALIRAEHRQAQIDLEVSRDRYLDLYDFAPVGYLTLSEEGRITQANRTGAGMLGEEREALLETDFVRFVLKEEEDHWRQHFLVALYHGNNQRLELTLRSTDGQRCPVQLDCIRVASESAAPMVRVTLTDISARKEAESNLRGFEAQLREVQKMESIGTLAGGIAHDFNNILGAILGNISLARTELGSEHAAIVNLDEIQKASLRARNLVQQILAFSRKAPQQLETQPLGPLVLETRQLLRATLPARVGFEVTLAETALYVHADGTQVQQVLMNLCTNAWHAMREGAGHIAVGLDPINVDVGHAKRLGGLPPGHYAHVWVSDDGSGMDAATREHIFEPFFTTKPVGQGTGLGLSVVHGIMTSHHGAIEVDSEPGKGSTFHLYFPLVAAPPSDRSGPDASIEPRRGQGQHVLYIDDDETMVVMVERILERSGYEVSGYQDAHAAVAAVRDKPTAYSLVVTDFNMPDMSGLDVAREISQIRPELPVVISSGYITEELRLQAKQCGVRSLLEKQNTFQELSDLVGRLVLRPN